MANLEFRGFVRSGALARPLKFVANYAYFRAIATLFYVLVFEVYYPARECTNGFGNLFSVRPVKNLISKSIDIVRKVSYVYLIGSKVILYLLIFQ